MSHIIILPFQPPSRNRRERAELRPDFFDSAAIIEDESVSIVQLKILRVLSKVFAGDPSTQEIGSAFSTLVALSLGVDHGFKQAALNESVIIAQLQ